MHMNSNTVSGFFTRPTDINARISVFTMAWCAAYAYMFLVLLPSILEGLVAVLGFPPDQVGYVGSAQMLGMLFGAVIATVSVRRFNLRIGITLGLVVIIGMELASSRVGDVLTLSLIRLVAGASAGFVAGLSMAGLAATRNPDSGFGQGITIQFVLGAALFLVLPYVIPVTGIAIVFYCLAAMGVTCLLLVGRLPVTGHADDLHGEGAPRLLRPSVILTLGAILLFYVFNNAVWAYVYLVGTDAGIPGETVGLALSVSMLGGILGAVLSVFAGGRFGRAVPITVSLILFMIGTAMLAVPFGTGAYFVSTFLMNSSLAFCIAFLLGTCAILDTVGRVVVLGNMMITLGLAVGPALAANLLNAGGYSTVLWVSVVGVGFSVVSILAGLFLAKQEKLLNGY